MEDYDVVTTTDGKEVLHLMHVEQPDLLLLVVGQPGCDGREISGSQTTSSRKPSVIFRSSCSQHARMCSRW
jgi:DNA-binding response OmpR family regulator